MQKSFVYDTRTVHNTTTTPSRYTDSMMIQPSISNLDAPFSPFSYHDDEEEEDDETIHMGESSASIRLGIETLESQIRLLEQQEQTQQLVAAAMTDEARNHPYQQLHPPYYIQEGNQMATPTIVLPPTLRTTSLLRRPTTKPQHSSTSSASNGSTAFAPSTSNDDHDATNNTIITRTPVALMPSRRVSAADLVRVVKQDCSAAEDFQPPREEDTRNRNISTEVPSSTCYASTASSVPSSVGTTALSPLLLLRVSEAYAVRQGGEDAATERTITVEEAPTNPCTIRSNSDNCNNRVLLPLSSKYTKYVHHGSNTNIHECDDGLRNDNTDNAARCDLSDFELLDLCFWEDDDDSVSSLLMNRDALMSSNISTSSTGMIPTIGYTPTTSTHHHTTRTAPSASARIFRSSQRVDSMIGSMQQEQQIEEYSNFAYSNGSCPIPSIITTTTETMAANDASMRADEDEPKLLPPLVALSPHCPSPLLAPPLLPVSINPTATTASHSFSDSNTHNHPRPIHGGIIRMHQELPDIMLNKEAVTTMTPLPSNSTASTYQQHALLTPTRLCKDNFTTRNTTCSDDSKTEEKDFGGLAGKKSLSTLLLHRRHRDQQSRLSIVQQEREQLKNTNTFTTTTMLSPNFYPSGHARRRRCDRGRSSEDSLSTLLLRRYYDEQEARRSLHQHQQRSQKQANEGVAAIVSFPTNAPLRSPRAPPPCSLPLPSRTSMTDPLRNAMRYSKHSMDNIHEWEKEHRDLKRDHSRSIHSAEASRRYLLQLTTNRH